VIRSAMNNQMSAVPMVRTTRVSIHSTDLMLLATVDAFPEPWYTACLMTLATQIAEELDEPHSHRIGPGAPFRRWRWVLLRRSCGRKRNRWNIIGASRSFGAVPSPTHAVKIRGSTPASAFMWSVDAFKAH
jgi:hypothetical protein